MLSILIPIYNQDATTLVSDLKEQCDALNIDYVILVYDDKSTRKWKKINASLHHEFKVHYMELSENLGRARIRNWLASAAPHPNLLFLDGDSGIHKDDYIKNYIELSKKPYDVVYGGRDYAEKPPRSHKRRLHWKYGKHVESIPAQKRNQTPALNFQSNNFLVNAKVFEKLKFDETVKGYGYEDLLLSERIVNAGFNIKHVDNPTLHLGLEKTNDFLEKNRNAIHNLVKIQREGLLTDTRLSLFYRKLEKFKLTFFIPVIYKRFSKKIEEKLHAKDPDVKAFQMTKLYWYHETKSDHES